MPPYGPFVFYIRWKGGGYLGWGGACQKNMAQKGELVAKCGVSRGRGTLKYYGMDGFPRGNVSFL